MAQSFAGTDEWKGAGMDNSDTETTGRIQKIATRNKDFHGGLGLKRNIRFHNCFFQYNWRECQRKQETYA